MVVLEGEAALLRLLEVIEARRHELHKALFEALRLVPWYRSLPEAEVKRTIRGVVRLYVNDLAGVELHDQAARQLLVLWTERLLRGLSNVQLSEAIVRTAEAGELWVREVARELSVGSTPLDGATVDRALLRTQALTRRLLTIAADAGNQARSRPTGPEAMWVDAVLHAEAADVPKLEDQASRLLGVAGSGARQWGIVCVLARRGDSPDRATSTAAALRRGSMVGGSPLVGALTLEPVAHVISLAPVDTAGDWPAIVRERRHLAATCEGLSHVAGPCNLEDIRRTYRRMTRDLRYLGVLPVANDAMLAYYASIEALAPRYRMEIFRRRLGGLLHHKKGGELLGVLAAMFVAGGNQTEAARRYLGVSPSEMGRRNRAIREVTGYDWRSRYDWPLLAEATASRLFAAAFEEWDSVVWGQPIPDLADLSALAEQARLVGYEQEPNPDSVADA